MCINSETLDIAVFFKNMVDLTLHIDYNILSEVNLKVSMGVMFCIM